MSKKEAFDLLCANGYETIMYNDKYPMVIYDDEDPLAQVKNLLLTNGYNATFGVMKKKKEVIDNDEII